MGQGGEVSEMHISASPWSHSGDTYVVAVNGDEQHAIWPAELGLPAGWTADSPRPAL